MNQDSIQSPTVLPGSTIGILGGGQLGRMMAIAAKQMGYFVHVYSASAGSPAGQLADREIEGSLDDLASIEDFAKSVDVITVETENIPVPTLEAAKPHVPAYPGCEALRVCQNRGLEKQLLVDNDIPTCKFQIIQSAADLHQACEDLLPSVLKTTTGGYDGKGQAVIRSKAEIEAAWESLNTTEAILEEWIEYEFEFSIVGVRKSDGSVAAYPSILNEHKNGILDVSTSPSGLSDEVNETATELVCRIMSQLDSVGVLTVEFFYRNGEVLVNEIAPRPHNSGHLTIEGHVTDQFEQHIRAVCNLPIGSTRQPEAVAMVNILGDEWCDGEPMWHLVLAQPNTKLHLYGKADPRPNRKMGHITSIGNSAEQAREQALAARNSLRAKASENADHSPAEV